MQYQKIISKIINIAEKDIDIESFIKLSFAELLLFSDNFIEIDTSFELVFNNANLKVVDNTRNFPKKCKIDKSGQCFCANATKLTQITECKKDKSNLTGSHYCIPIFNEQKTQAILVLHAINQLDNIKSEFIKTIKNLLETFIRTKNREKKLISKAQQQNFLNQKLFSQSLEIDQKNLEIEEQKLQIEEQNEELRQNNEELQSLIENIEKQKEIIKESEEKYIFIAKNVSDVIWIWNLNKNKFTYISPAVYSLRGYTVEEAIRTHLLDSFTQSSAEYIAMQSQIRLEIFIKNHKEKIFYTDELQQYCKNGDIIWTEASTQFAFNKKNEIEVFGISRNINNRKKAELELKTAHKSITDSINYAKRIQTAILPSKNLLLKKLSKHFVLFKPRDVVSGDFYWWTNIKHYTIITVADCTGHGVPGAFMSMLGISILRDIINKQNFTNTSVILQKLRTEIIKTLQSGTQDGMDMAIISINQKTNTLQFSGSFFSSTPLIFHSSVSSSLIIIPLTRFSIQSSE